MQTIKTTIDALKAKRSELDVIIRDAEALSLRLDEFLIGEEAIGDPEGKPPSRERDKKQTLAEAVLALLIRTDVEEWPMKTRTILDKLKEKGVKVGGKKPLITLYSALKRSSQFEKMEDGTGWKPTTNRF